MLRRTGFRRRPYVLGVTMPIKREKRLNKSGRRTKAWDNKRRKLKKEFEAVGITACELQLEGCTGNDGLGFMHANKRRNIPDIESAPVLLACANCHWKWEKLGEAEMHEKVMARIEKRNAAFRGA